MLFRIDSFEIITYPVMPEISVLQISHVESVFANEKGYGQLIDPSPLQNVSDVMKLGASDLVEIWGSTLNMF